MASTILSFITNISVITFHLKKYDNDKNTLAYKVTRSLMILKKNSEFPQEVFLSSS